MAAERELAFTELYFGGDTEGMGLCLWFSGVCF